MFKMFKKEKAAKKDDKKIIFKEGLVKGHIKPADSTPRPDVRPPKQGRIFN